MVGSQLNNQDMVLVNIVVYVLMYNLMIDNQTNPSNLNTYLEINKQKKK
jgi:hypothetical protein